MLALQTLLGRLDLAAGSIGIECLNPYFSFDKVPGTTTYPFQVPMTPDNLIRLNFPHVRAAQGETPAPEPADFYIEELLWRVGSLRYQGCDEDKQQLLYDFVADAADLQAQIEGLTLPTMALGEVPFVTDPFQMAQAPDYALPCVRNTLFYGAKDKNPGYSGILNRYRDGLYAAGPLTPFLRLQPLLRRVLAAVGYAVSGPWFEEEEAQQLVVYSDRRHDPAVAVLQVNRHVPDISPGELLVAVQKLLGLGYDFLPARRELRITSLRYVMADPTYIDRAGATARTTAAANGGYLLKMGLESGDELNKTLDTSWAELRIGAGKTTLDTGAGTLHMVREADPLDPGRLWLVPAVEVPGATTELGLSDESRCGLRLLYDRGLQPASGGDLYPLASSGSETYAGVSCGTEQLHWAGVQGLYAQRHQAWLEFLDRAGEEERTVPFGIADLLTLVPARKEMVGFRKYFWQRISLSVPVNAPLEQARITHRHVRL
ncbi:hypothetical protein [Hymenobacter algoricola]|uniref:Uncharacterized protein n=1 Tax=Hymenobacter algoricola TaxID=486267 RepID=A0ABP7NVB7_9BACT